MALKYELREWAQSRSRMNCMTLFPTFCGFQDRYIFVSGTLRRAREMVSPRCKRLILAALSLTDPPHLLRQGARAAGCMQALSSACSNAMVSERPPCCRRLWGLDSKVKAKVQLGDAGISGGTAAAFTLSVL